MTLLDAMADPALFGPVFGGPTWAPWRAFVAAVFGLPLDAEGLALYHQATGRTAPPPEPVREAFALCGRRSGKSIVAALLAVFCALFRHYRLAPGETPVILIAAVDKRQAQVILDYCRGLLEASRLTRAEVAQTTAETITLRSGVRIEVRSNNFRSIRGVTCAAAVIDEACFLRDEDSSAPDVELHRALRPALSTTRGLLVAISSPWSKRGLMYQQWRKHHGRDGDPVLTWVAPSAVMNPTLDAAMIEEALTDDPVAAKTEWGAAWRDDLSPFLSQEMVDQVAVPGRHELPPVTGLRYAGFLDASGGSQDSFTCAVGHGEDRDGQRVAVLDAIRERPAPFDPADVVREYSRLLKDYGLTTATADRYAGAWVTSAFAEHGVAVEQSAAPKSDLYLGLLPLITSRRCELLDNARLLSQLVNLERRAAASGKQTVSERPGARDDVANAVAGALLATAVPAEPGLVTWYRLQHEAALAAGAPPPSRYPRSPNSW